MPQQSATGDAFAVSRSLLGYARKRLNELYAEINPPKEGKHYIGFSETDDDTGEKHHKFRFASDFLNFCCFTSLDIISNCRTVLDTIGYDLAVRDGIARPRYTHFPFGDTIDEVQNRANGGSKEIPSEIFVCMAAFKPYMGGDDLLWAMNKARNASLHRVIAPNAVRTPGGYTFSDIEGVITSLTFPIDGWDPSKNELAFLITPPDYGAQHKITVPIHITFGEIEGIEGLPIFPVLDGMLRITDSILSGIEAEAQRIGLIV